jgi:hypothetical protein
MTAGVLAVLMLSGCAQLTIDADGTRRVTGFVRIELPPATDLRNFGGESLRIQALGLLLSRSGPESALTVGYTDSFHALVKADSCVALRNPRDHQPGSNLQ